jgi:uncharacterized RDD family membrane protein YckC
MASFTYEGMLLFAIAFATTWVYSVLTGQRHALAGRLGLIAVLAAVFMAYFVYCWTRSGQTVAMQAWHVRLVDRQGQAVRIPRAMARFAMSLLWFVPALLSTYLQDQHSLGAIFGSLGAGVVGYALISFLHPRHQFLHDAICGTELIEQKPMKR